MVTKGLLVHMFFFSIPSLVLSNFVVYLFSFLSLIMILLLPLGNKIDSKNPLASMPVVWYTMGVLCEDFLPLEYIHIHVNVCLFIYLPF